MRLLTALALIAFPGAGLAAQATWTVDAKPILDVPGVTANGSVTFANMAGVTRLRDGSLLIADRGSNSIRLVDPRGKLVKSSGQTGDGPGDFQSMIWAGGCGPDSMLVWDLRRRVASMIGASGTVARQFKVPSDSGTKIRVPLNVIACGDRGTIAYISDPTGRVAPTSANPNIMGMLSSAVTTNREGHVVAHIDSLPSGEMYHTISPTGGNGAFPRPLGIAAFVAVIGDRAVVGLTDSARVVAIEPDGRRTTIRIPVQAHAPTRDEFDASVEKITAMAPAAMRLAMTEQLSKAPLPAVAPTYSGLFSDPAGLLWVEVSPATGKNGSLIAMQLDGKIVGRLALPMPMTVSEIGRDYILGTFEDANDEMHVVVLKLNRK